MVNLAQVIKDLRAERSRAQKEVDRLEKPSARFRNWLAIPEGTRKRMRQGKGGDLPPPRGKGFRGRRKRAGQRFDDRRRPRPEADTQ